MGSHSVACHPTQVNGPRLNLSQGNWYLMVLLYWRDGRPTWPRWLATCQDGLPAHRRSPIMQVLTGPDVDQLHWSRPMYYH